MIQTESVLDVADNSGAKRVKCLKVLGGSKRRYASVGDIITVSIKEAAPNSKVKKGRFIERLSFARRKRFGGKTAVTSASTRTVRC